ncbi:MAG TPA: family 10 glycosylhydrolase [Actinomycetota bacterium]|nr:family 10 glycosylhydrolase [Actinomycetota bacterium]
MADPTVAQYRAFWVDTFNTPLNHHSDVAAVVANATAAHANAIFAQVRRRGDAWYRDALEPLPDGVPIAAGFDPLAELIGQAHAAGMEVHAFVIIGAVWNRPPTQPPSSPEHVFNRHGFDPQTGQPRQGRANWLTRALLPDGGPISFGGYRFGNDFWIDPGHPDAAAYTAEVLLHLVRRYDLDGLHLDRIRYPELAVGGQTPTTGASIGYNPVSLHRYRRHHGLPEDGPPPDPGDPSWSQWRRDQVTGLVRRIYLGALAHKPALKVSAALIAFGNGPTSEATWPAAEAFWRVYQDWRAWTEEGLVDLAVPMVYKTEHTTGGQAAFDQWSQWTSQHQYGRAALIGQGASLNAIEGTLRQTRRALAPSPSGQSALGVVFFSLANSNAAVTSNPHAIPAGQSTPRRTLAEFASGLVTGRSVDGAVRYEDPASNPTPIFAAPATVPELAWKTNPQVGHLLGVVTDEAGQPVDGAEVTIAPASGDPAVAPGPASLTTHTDGGGGYGGVDLAPGSYQVTVTPPGQPPFPAPDAVPVSPGQVARLDIIVDRNGPTVTLGAQPSGPLLAPVTIAGTAQDPATGIASVALRVLGSRGELRLGLEPIDGQGAPSVSWTRTILLEAPAHPDPVGQTYTVEATATDRAGNTHTTSVTITVARQPPEADRVAPRSI